MLGGGTPSILPRDLMAAAATGSCETCNGSITDQRPTVFDRRRTPVSTPSRTPDEIAAEIAETRNRLAGTIDQLVYRVQPKTIVERKIASTKASFVNPDGSLKKDKVLKVAGVVVGVLVTLVVIRKIVG
jgi:hypothetical protein